MSDINYQLSSIVKICRTCLTNMSIIVIICLTYMSIIVAEYMKTEITMWENIMNKDNIENSIATISISPVKHMSDSKHLMLLTLIPTISQSRWETKLAERVKTMSDKTSNNGIVAGEWITQLPLLSNRYVSERAGILSITAIVADGPWDDRDGTESITFTNQWATAHNLMQVMLIVNNNILGTLSGTLQAWQSMTITSYFPLPNDGGCVAVVEWWHLYDQVCYRTYETKDLVHTWSRLWSTVAPFIPTAQLKASREHEERELINLDLHEQKLINTWDSKVSEKGTDGLWQQHYNYLSQHVNQCYNMQETVSQPLTWWSIIMQTISNLLF